MMGARGPAPTPTAVLKARGSWRAKTRKNEPKPEIEKDIPTCPHYMKGEARSAWNYLCIRLHKSGLLTKIDRPKLERYCVLYGRWRRAEDKLKDGMDVIPVRNDAGQTIDLKPSPYVAIAGGLADRLEKIESQFGIGPAARTRIVVDRSDKRISESSNKVLKYLGGAG